MLEVRRLLTAFEVTTTAASGLGSLDQAIRDANAHPGPDDIIFTFADDVAAGTLNDGDIASIRPTSPLPAITDTVHIDGGTWSIDPNRVELFGIGLAGTGAAGLEFRAGGDGSTIQGLHIYGFAKGIETIDAADVTIVGNVIGSGGAADLSLLNDYGIHATNSPRLHIGTDQATNLDGVSLPGGNKIVGNRLYGIRLDSGDNSGAVIDANVVGPARSPDRATGIYLGAGADGSVIGSDVGNTISGNTGDGIFVGSNRNRIDLNLLGTDETGTLSVADGTGIRLGGASDNTIGSADAGNLIGGYFNTGLVVQNGSARNLILGNEFGVIRGTSDPIYFVAEGGVLQYNNAQPIRVENSEDNTIGGSNPGAGNLLVGHDSPVPGLELYLSDRTLIQGNTIGTSSDGTGTGRGFQEAIRGYLSRATIGGTTPAARNLIGGASSYGIDVYCSPGDPADAHPVLIQGNFIGTARDGLAAGSPNEMGILIDQPDTPASSTATVVIDRNLISGNDVGLILQGSRVLVTRNTIGLDVTGLTRVPASLAMSGGSDYSQLGIQDRGGANTIGAVGLGNLIAGNTTQIELWGDGSSVSANTLGTLADFSSAFPGSAGISVSAGRFNTIGGALPGEGNVIGLAQTLGPTGIGVELLSPSDSSVVLGNTIGTSPDGSINYNEAYGVNVSDSPNNTIGGAAPNVIAGTNYGIYLLGGGAVGNLVEGNLVGTDPTGTSAPIGNEIGIFTRLDARAVIRRNLVSGNRYGIVFSNETSGSTVVGNTVGLDITGGRAIGNLHQGIESQVGNTIGGPNPGDGNIISGNPDRGLYVGLDNLVQGNFIGTDATGLHAIGNRIGIQIGEGGNTIGGSTPGTRNIVSGNSGNGIESVSFTNGNTIQGNYIGVGSDGRSADPYLTNVLNAVDGPSGRTVTDRLGGATVTAVGVSYPTDGLFGGAIGFDGSGASSLSVTTPAVNTSTIAVDLWVRGTAQTPDAWIFASTPSADGTQAAYRLTTGPTGGLQFGVHTATKDAVTTDNGERGWDARSASLVWDGNWHHVAAIFDGFHLSLSVDGIQVGWGEAGLGGEDIDYSLQSVPGPLVFGNRPGAVGQFRGEIEDVGVHRVGSWTSPFFAAAAVRGIHEDGMLRGLPKADPLGNDRGISLTTYGVTRIEGNVVGGNRATGIAVDSGFGTGSSLIVANTVGLDATGLSLAPNQDGIQVTVPSTIGGVLRSDGNLVSGNIGTGIVVGYTNNVSILNNVVGLDRTGTRPLANDRGISVNAATQVTIGGIGVGNTVSGNISDNGGLGIELNGGSDYVVQGNYLGTDALGDGLDPTAGLLLSGDQGPNDGLYLNPVSASNGLTYGPGKIGQAYGFDGTGSSFMRVADGFWLEGVPAYHAFQRLGITVDFWVKGVDPAANADQVLVSKGSDGSGGYSYAFTTDAAGGLRFSLGRFPGTPMDSPTADAATLWDGRWHHVAGTFQTNGLLGSDQNIHLYVDGEEVGSGTPAYLRPIFNLPEHNDLIVGGLLEHAGDATVSHPFRGMIDDLAVYGSALTRERIADIASEARAKVWAGNGNGALTIGAATNILVGGTAPGEGNLISGNLGDGISTYGGNDGLVILGNTIGLNLQGTSALGNLDGVSLAYDTNAVIGSPAAGNTISGNASWGLTLIATYNALVQSNQIGTDATGMRAIGNGGGIAVAGNFTGGFKIGGHRRFGEGNQISGNGAGLVLAFTSDAGVTSLIQGNDIGTDAAGSAPLGNGIGIFATQAEGLTIGGDNFVDSLGNVISGNLAAGIRMKGPDDSFRDILIAGNLIGVDASSGVLMGNGGPGIQATVGRASNIRIGLNSLGYENSILGNQGEGIYVAGSGVSITHNRIGSSTVGIASPNRDDGIEVIGSDNRIDLNDVVEPLARGIYVEGASNTVSGNFVRFAHGDGISVGPGSISTLVDSNRALFGSGNGISVFGAEDTTISQNIVSANLGDGVLIQGTPSNPSARNRVLGNVFSNDSEGGPLGGNLRGGVEIRDSDLDRVGGAGGDGNRFDQSGIPGVPSNPDAFGILLWNATRATIQNNVFSGQLQGIVLDGGSSGNLIGGANDAVVNTLIGGDKGLVLRGGATGNRIQRNKFGYDTSPTDPTPIHTSVVIDSAVGNTLSGNTFVRGQVAVALTNPGDAANLFPDDIYVGSTVTSIRLGSGSGQVPNDPGNAYPNTPVITRATIRAGYLEVSGWVASDTRISFYAANPNASGFGEGSLYLGSYTEGSDSDFDPGTGSYGPIVNGTYVGTDVGAKRFRFVFQVPSTVPTGTTITALAIGRVDAVGRIMPGLSQFSNDATSDGGTAFGAPVIALGGNAVLAEGGTLARQGVFTDMDSTSWTATVDYDDGNGPQVLKLNPVTKSASGDEYTAAAAGTFDLNVKYVGVGIHHVVVRVRDDSGKVGVAGFDVNVVSAPPAVDNPGLVLTPSTIPQGGTVVLTGPFSDETPVDQHVVTILWGDGSHSSSDPGSPDYDPSILVDEIGKTFSASHTYEFASPNDTPTFAYPVLVTIIDAGHASGSSVRGLVYAQVTNVLPSNLQVAVDRSDVYENQGVTLNGSFVDPGTSDTHELTVDWGDGTAPTVVSLAPGVTTFSNLFHRYLNNPNTVGSKYHINVQLADGHQPLAPTQTGLDVVVRDIAPQWERLDGSSLAVDEGSAFLLSGAFLDPGPADRHNVVINWGDGSTPTTLSLGFGEVSFSDVRHVYKNNPNGQPHGTYRYVVTVSDPAETSLPGRAIAGLVTVDNVAPTVDPNSLWVVLKGSPAGSPNLSTIDEGDRIVLTGSYADAGVLDRHRLRIEWGDGTASSSDPSSSEYDPTLSLDAAHRTFSARHRYLNNAVGTLVGVDIIRVTVTDDSGASSSATRPLSIRNIAPTAHIDVTGVGAAGGPTLSAVVGDQGPVDETSLEFHWTVNGNTYQGANLVLSSAVTGFNAGAGGSLDAVLSVEDDDGVVTTSRVRVDIMNAVDTVYQIPNPGPGYDAVLVIGNDLPNVIAAGTLRGGILQYDPASRVPLVDNRLNIPVVLDGGAGADVLIGGNADDLIHLRNGNDSAYGGPGADRYYLRPNSTLTVVDGEGNNALDFSDADFGISFNLGLSRGQAQEVHSTLDPLDPHIVTVDDLGTGKFGTLVGSGFDDEFRPASDSVIRGGGGNDSIKFDGAYTTYRNVQLFGDKGDLDVLIDRSSVADDLLVNGGADANTLVNLGTMSGDLVFNGGADADTLTNQGSISNPIIFNGDEGANEFINFGFVAGATFSGGADIDTFVNNVSGVIGSLVFNGDDGANSLSNLGSIANDLVFNGGADVDTLANSGSILGSLVFNGDDGANQLINSGSMGGSSPEGSTLGSLVFNGGADVDTLMNSGSISSPLIFNGDDGANTLINASDPGGLIPGSILSGLVFSGGADADTLYNPGTILGGFTFNAEDGANTLINSGTIVGGEGALGSLVFTGGADVDVFVNTAAGTIATSIVFNGDAGPNRFENAGTIVAPTLPGGEPGFQYRGGADVDTLVNDSGATLIGSLVFQGDDGANSLVNLGTVVGDLLFEGGADIDTLVNSASGAIDGGIVFNGDDGADLLLNLGEIGDLLFEGGADVDTLRNEGSVLGSLVFNGDAGADTLINLGSASSLVFTGGADVDTLYNIGRVDTSLVFTGGDGADVLRNEGSVDRLVFNGGADADTLINSGPVGDLVFNGGADVNTLINTADSVSTLTFNGDEGRLRLLNRGADIGQILVQGGSGGANLIVNFGDRVGSLDFLGSSDVDTLVNYGSDVALTFNGDDGADTLVNYGGSSASNVSIIFTGGADADTLINNGSNVGTIVFNGDDGADTLINNGSVGSLVFNGGADQGGNPTNDVDALLSTGSAGTIVLNGGGAATVLRNNGSAGHIDYNGGSRTNYLLNVGVVGSLSFRGGADVDTLVNRDVIGGVEGSASTFNGDDGADLLVNLAGGVISGLTFEGGADIDTLVNAGTMTDVTFNGDDGANVLINLAGSSAESLLFNGGADVDTLINRGAVDGLTFNGDAGDDILALDGESTSDVVFNGGEGNDLLSVSANDRSADNIEFHAGSGFDRVVNRSEFTSGLTAYAEDSTLLFWNLANRVSYLSLYGGSSRSEFHNIGDGVSSVYVASGKGGLLVSNTGAFDTGYTILSGAGSFEFDNAGDGLDDLTLIAGSGDVTLRNAGNNIGIVRLFAGAGNASLINSGNDVDSLSLVGGTGTSSLINSGNRVRAICLYAGLGASSLQNSGDNIGFLSLFGTNVTASETLVNDGHAVGVVRFDGGDGVDTAILRGSIGTASIKGGSAADQFLIFDATFDAINLAGGAGDDSYELSGTNTGSLTIDERAAADSDSSVDTIDFSGLLVGVRFDLGSTLPQPLPNGLIITLTDGMGIENLIGTGFSDVLIGNDRPNRISGTALPDKRIGSITPAPYAAGPTAQWVLLDFDTYSDADGRVYLPAERDAIQSIVQADYTGPDPSHPWFNVVFTQNLLDIPAELRETGGYAVEYFNRTPSFGRPGGEASEVDFGNSSRGGFTSIQVNGLLGGVGQPDETSSNFVRLSAKIAAHELAHLMGVRHTDAFGPIGLGIHTPPGSSSFDPTYPGPGAAFESGDHLISSPATQGTDRFNDLGPLYFGPREAIKLALADHGQVANESESGHDTPGNAQPLDLASLSVPNTTPSAGSPLAGVEADRSFQVLASAVSGSIRIDPTTGRAETDYYSFQGRKGDVFTLEIESSQLAALRGGASIDSVLSVVDADGNPIAYYDSQAVNDDQFEPTDSALFDLVLPSTGTFYVKITSFSRSQSDPIFDASNPDSPLNPGNLASRLNPLNPNFNSSLLGQFLGTRYGTNTGDYNLLVYRFNQANQLGASDTIDGRGGDDLIQGYSAGDELVGGAGADRIDNGLSENSYRIALVPSDPEPSVFLPAAFEETVRVIDPSGAATWDVTIDYGDGTVERFTRDAAETLPLSHRYSGAGDRVVTVTLLNDDGVSTDLTLTVHVAESAAPKATILAPTSGAETRLGRAVEFRASVDNAYVGHSYTADWTIVNLAGGPDASRTLHSSFVATESDATISASTSFSFVGVYSFRLKITDTTAGRDATFDTVGDATASFSVYDPTTSVRLSAGNSTYDGHVYAGASATVQDATGTGITTPGVTFVYRSGLATSGPGQSTPPTDAGTYTVTANFAGNERYDPSSASMVFTIRKATLTIDVSNASKTYGDANPSLGGSVQGAVPSDGLSVTFATPAVVSSPVGSYPIVATIHDPSNRLSNYDVINNPGHLDVVARVVTIGMNAIDVGRGDAFPSPTFTYGNLAPGDTVASLGGSPSYGTSATPASPAGIYAAVPTRGTLNSGNYSFNFTPTSVTIHPKVLDIRAVWGGKSVSLIGLGRDLPFVNIQALDVIFSDPVSPPAASALTLASRSVAGKTYSSASVTAKSSSEYLFNLPTAMGIDSLMATIDRTKVAANFAGGSVSLNATSSWNFDVLPGDYNGDRSVLTNDGTSWKSAMTSYSIWADFDGNGVLDSNDLLAIQKRVGTSLPK